MATDTRYVYTLSSVAALPEYLVLSLRTLTQFVDPKQITVFYTPPRTDEHWAAIAEFGVDLRLVPNATDAFSPKEFYEPRHYGDKTWLCECDEDTVVFLDCDTLIFNDPAPLTDGEFDFAARPGTSELIQPGWRELFDRFGRADQYMDWMPNCGVLVFKNGIHNEIGEQWREFINTDLEYRLEVADHHEQYALALTVGGYDLQKLSKKEHVMYWRSEFPVDGIVYHLAKSLEIMERENEPKNVLDTARLGMHHLKHRNFGGLSEYARQLLTFSS